MTTKEGGTQKQPRDPPYLLTAAERLSPQVAVNCDAGMTVVEMAVRGRWTPELGEQISAALRMCLAGAQTAIVVALHGLADPDGASLSFWLRLWREARFAPAPVHLTFSIAPTTALSRRLRFLQGPQPRIYATVPEARAAIATRDSPVYRRQAQWEPQAASVGAARSFVSQACHDWDRPKLLPDTALIASELVTNAVEHACTEFIVTMSRRDTRLYVVVHDRVGEFPSANDLKLADQPVPAAGRERGLRLVHATAVAWGAVPTPTGKVVWAAVT